MLLKGTKALNVKNIVFLGVQHSYNKLVRLSLAYVFTSVCSLKEWVDVALLNSRQGRKCLL
jgi:hypothetical protein